MVREAIASEQKAMAVSGIGAIIGFMGDLAGWGAIVLVVSLLGWAVSSLDQLAGWTDDATKLVKLTIIKGIFASIAAAAIVVLIGNWMQWHPMGIVIGAFLGGMAGDKLLRPLADGMVARLAAGLQALIGNGKSP